MADLIRRNSLVESASRMTVHGTFGADRGSGSQLHEVQLLGIEWPALTNRLSQRFHRCDVLRMLPCQPEIEARFVTHRAYFPNESRRLIVLLNTSLPGCDSTLSAQK